LSWRVDGRAARIGIVAGALALPLLWFGGDWIGSGRLTTGIDRALRPIPNTPGTAPHPARAVLAEAAGMLPWPAWIGLAIATGAAAIAWIGARPQATAVQDASASPIRGASASAASIILALAACAAIWTAIVALMAERGYAGVPRFLFMASGLEAVLAGIGVALLVAWRGRTSVAVATLVLAAFAYGSVPAVERLPTEVAGIDKVADLDAGHARTVREAGGAANVMRCGEPVTRWYTVTALAWDLDVPAAHVRHDRRGGPLLEACRRRFVLAQQT
jgi:hypothetical protein